MSIDDIICRAKFYERIGSDDAMVLKAEFDRLRAEVERLREDKERLDWLDSLKDRHAMIACHKGRHNPTGFRRYDCESDLHLRGGTASLYLRDELGHVTISGVAENIRAAIDAARAALAGKEGK